MSRDQQNFEKLQNMTSEKAAETARAGDSALPAAQQDYLERAKCVLKDTMQRAGHDAPNNESSFQRWGPL